VCFGQKQVPMLKEWNLSRGKTNSFYFTFRGIKLAQKAEKSQKT